MSIFRICFFTLSILPVLGAQETEGLFLKDVKTGCTVWFKHTFSEDSISWSGACKDDFAEGFGVMEGFTKGLKTSGYKGMMKRGKPDGLGTFTFGKGLKLEGNFSNGEILNLKPVYLEHLNKHLVPEQDSAAVYVGDNNQQALYYHALVPKGTLKGAIVLMPGTWGTTENVISSTQELCETAYDHQLAVLVMSINQRLTMTDKIVGLMNSMLSDAITRYAIPAGKIALGGFSMGGLFSLRYTELAHQFLGKTAIVPAAVFSCDGPCDLEHIYQNFQLKLKKFPQAGEPAYGIRELETYCQGSPAQSPERYAYYSCYSHAQADGGNARYLSQTPVRIYNDVDPVWWMEQRRVDMYDLNALDQTAMILKLNEMGNSRASFINAFGKGYRLEGNRHPHSWSIIAAQDCVEWVLNCLK